MDDAPIGKFSGFMTVGSLSVEDREFMTRELVTGSADGVSVPNWDVSISA